ncbi:hypothetical protein [Microbacterium hominis]|uniref:hypothetical protein n=1 Tax=Microbacterium hominis TaxID=162426 RepID=UPI0035312A2B
MVSLRVAALEVQTQGEARVTAALIRSDVAASVERLHDVLDVLRRPDVDAITRVEAALGRVAKGFGPSDSLVMCFVTR